MTGNGAPSPGPALSGRSFWGTPFHRATGGATGTPFWYAWDNCHVVDLYTDVDREVEGFRRAAAIGDMSPLNKTLVDGPGSCRLAERMATRTSARLSAGAPHGRTGNQRHMGAYPVEADRVRFGREGLHRSRHSAEHGMATPGRSREGGGGSG